MRFVLLILIGALGLSAQTNLVSGTNVSILPAGTPANGTTSISTISTGSNRVYIQGDPTTTVDLMFGNGSVGNDEWFLGRTAPNDTNFYLSHWNGTATVSPLKAATDNSLLTIGSSQTILNGLATNVVSKSANYTMASNDFNVVATGTTALTFTLPTSPVNGQMYTVKNRSTKALTVNAQSGSNIDSYANTQIPATGSVELFYDTTNAGWQKSLPLPVYPPVVVLTYSATPFFSFSAGSIQQMTLTGNVTSFTANYALAGSTVIFDFIQDATGSRTVTWPSAFHGVTTIGTTALKHNTQQFYTPDGTNFYATAAGVINQ